MTEDQRVARDPREPDKRGPAGVERWIGYLDWVRADLVAAVLALDPTERRRTRVPSGWTPIELLSHVLHMEQRWFVWGFLGEQVDAPWGDWAADDGASRERWHVTEEVSAEELAQRLEAVAARSRDVLRTHPLDAVAARGGRFAADPPTLEWICFHVLPSTPATPGTSTSSWNSAAPGARRLLVRRRLVRRWFST